MKPDETKQQVIMAHSLATRWLQKVAAPEYRVGILFGASHYQNLVNLLRAFRDGKVSINGFPPIRDLGIRESFDGLELWSSDMEALSKLDVWLASKGLETTGVC